MSVKYELIIYGRESDSAFIVEVPELPGSRLDGQTYIEAVTNVEVVIQEWIETAQVIGTYFSKPERTFNFMLNEFF